MAQKRIKKIAKPRRDLTDDDRAAIREKIMTDFAPVFEYLRKMGD